MKIFKTFESVTGMRECIKRPIIVHAQPIDEEFQVETLEGNYKTGKPGDYLMQGIDDELYICDKDIFERSYDWVTHWEPGNPQAVNIFDAAEGRN